MSREVKAIVAYVVAWAILLTGVSFALTLPKDLPAMAFVLVMVGIIGLLCFVIKMIHSVGKQ